MVRAFKLVSLLLLLFLTNVQAFAGEGSGEGTGEAPSAVTLSGQVVKVEVTLNNLRDARLSITRVRKALANLYDEVTRQQMTMTYMPNVVGTMVFTIPTPVFTGIYLPARKKWVVGSMGEIGPIITLFKEDVEAAIESDRRTEVTERGRKQLDPIREEVFSLVKASFDDYKTLESLTAGEAYDNRAIATTTRALDKRIRRLDGRLKRAVSILQREAKAAKRA